MKKIAMAAAMRTARAIPTPMPAEAPDESPWEVLLFPTDPTLDPVLVDDDDEDEDEDEVVVEEEPEEESVAEAEAEAGDDDDGDFSMLASSPKVTMGASYISDCSRICAVVDIEFRRKEPMLGRLIWRCVQHI
jgi:hypothetical protein